MLWRSRHTHYEFGDKASKILAHQLKQESASQLITKIETAEGYTYDNKIINDMFRDFYSSVYSSEHDSCPIFDSFFSKFEHAHYL